MFDRQQHNTLIQESVANVQNVHNLFTSSYTELCNEMQHPNIYSLNSYILSVIQRSKGDCGHLCINRDRSSIIYNPLTSHEIAKVLQSAERKEVNKHIYYLLIFDQRSPFSKRTEKYHSENHIKINASVCLEFES